MPVSVLGLESVLGLGLVPVFVLGLESGVESGSRLTDAHRFSLMANLS